MINHKDFLATINGDGEWTPSFSHVLAEDGNKRLTADVFIQEGDFNTTTLFCIYIGDEGEYAGNEFEDAVKEFNAIT